MAFDSLVVDYMKYLTWMPRLVPFKDFYVDVYFADISVVDCKAYFPGFSANVDKETLHECIYFNL